MKIMHTMASQARTQVPKRRFYSPELKLQVVKKCGEPGASIAAVALGHGINANIVHRWLREHNQPALVVQSSAFVPVTLGEAVPVPTRQSAADIRVEIQCANTSIVVKWPLEGSNACAAWLREWLARSELMRCVWQPSPMDMRAGTDTALTRVV